MKLLCPKLQFLALIFIFSLSTIKAQSVDYFGQTPPGDSAVIFAPGIFSLSDRLESNIAFSSDGREIYFGVVEIKDNSASYKIYYTKYLNNKWTEQAETSFSAGNDICNPYLSADGKKLYFEKSGDIWMIERTAEGWGKQKQLEPPINSESYEASYMETADGNAYISSKRPGGLGGMDIWYLKRMPDQSIQAENLGPLFNTELFDYSPFLAPDGSYFIFGSYRKGKFGQADLFISFKDENKEWTDPINMNSCGAKINNTTAHHSQPSLSPDGKFLFFRRHETLMEMDVYWVSAGVIEELKDRALSKFTDLKGDYLGQTLPYDIPVVFAPGIISVDSTIEHGSPCFSPDGNTVFWQSNLRHAGKDTEIFLNTMLRVDGQWTEPEASPFGGMPAFSQDGNKLIFISSETEKEKGLYLLTKQGDGWSEAKSMRIITRFPELRYLYGPSITNNGTLYFFAHAEGLGSRNDFGIYRSEFINGSYAKPELLPSSINIAEAVLNWTPFIAPDESYLLFSSDRDSSQQNLFISFRHEDGTWTEAYNLGAEINAGRGQRFPAISPDGRYMFFTRWVAPGNEDVMWVSSEIIDKIRREKNNK
jgi:Tol biopolymer transport system component